MGPNTIAKIAQRHLDFHVPFQSRIKLLFFQFYIFFSVYVIRLQQLFVRGLCLLCFVIRDCMDDVFKSPKTPAKQMVNKTRHVPVFLNVVMHTQKLYFFTIVILHDHV